MSHVEEFIPFLKSELDLEVTDAVEYSWLDENEFPRASCPESSAGCQVENHAYSRKPALLHELVHAVTYGAGMNQLSFFTEGIAVAYDPFDGTGGGPRYRFNPPEGEMTLDPRDYMLGMLDASGYDLAGSFVTFLLLRHGSDKFVKLSTSLKYDSQMQDIRAAFLNAYNLTLDEEVETFMENGSCGDENFDVPTYDCTMPNVPWAGNVWALSTTMDCDSNMVVGGVDRRRPSNSAMSVALEVPAAGSYTLNIQGDSRIQVALGRCFGCPWWPRDHVTTSDSAIEVDLAAGPHFVRLTAPSEEKLEVEITLVRAE